MLISLSLEIAPTEINIISSYRSAELEMCMYCLREEYYEQDRYLCIWPKDNNFCIFAVSLVAALRSRMLAIKKWTDFCRGFGNVERILNQIQ